MLVAIIYFHMPNILQTVLDAGHYYKTKCEVLGDDAPRNF